MGWNPTFDDVEAKTIEPWILHHFDQDFYGCYLRLLLGLQLLEPGFNGSTAPFGSLMPRMTRHLSFRSPQKQRQQDL